MKSLNILVIVVFLIVTACKSQFNLNINPVDPKATASTVKLLVNMKAVAAKGIMIGHQDDMAYGIGWKAPDGTSDVFRVCSDFPAVFGWDLCGLENESEVNLDSVPFSDMAKYALEVYSKGGVNSFSWHSRNPLTDGSAWDISAKGVVKSILQGGENLPKYNKWLDHVASFLSALKDNKGEPIPVIFRPFHEQTGDWFWWGKAHCTPEEFSQLWQYTVKYLTETKKLHNLIFAFSTGGSFNNVTEYSDRYPGDNFVDIIGFDLYQDPQQPGSEFAKSLSGKLKILNEFAKDRNKLPAITEIGYEQIPDPEWWTKVFYAAAKDFPVSYALFWRNAANRPNHYYMPYPGQVSEEDFRKFYALPGTLFLKDIEKIKLYK
jgi:mannan endo-1,4-beta-mannosidase